MMHEQSSVFLNILMPIISLQYGVVAIIIGMSVMSIPKGRRDYKKIIAVAALVLIFLFCAFSGYISRWLDFSVRIMEVSHGILVLLNAVFILTGQGAVIGKALRRD